MPDNVITDKKISVIIPCYNEEPNIINMYNRLTNVLKKTTSNYEILFIDNGSFDNSHSIFKNIVENDENVIVIQLSRNFGSSQPAYTCGLEYATGDCAVLIDGDIQDPPELIEQMVEKWQEGFDVVYGIRKKRKGNIIRRICYKLFYRIYRKMAYIDVPLDASDFGLVDRRVIDVMNSLPEKNRFIRGLRSWVGFNSTGIEYIREDRQAGKTKFTFMDNIRWAKMGLLSFSYYPLELISSVAAIMTLFSIIGVIIYIINYFVDPSTPRGFSTIIVLILFIGSIQLLSLCIIGEYLAKVFEETKARPKYVISNIMKNENIKKD